MSENCDILQFIGSSFSWEIRFSPASEYVPFIKVSYDLHSGNRFSFTLKFLFNLEISKINFISAYICTYIRFSSSAKIWTWAFFSSLHCNFLCKRNFTFYFQLQAQRKENFLLTFQSLTLLLCIFVTNEI